MLWWSGGMLSLHEFCYLEWIEADCHGYHLIWEQYFNANRLA